MAERLHVVLARVGIASRRHAEKLISEGRVTVNGQVVLEPGTRVDWEKDAIKVDERLVFRSEPRVTVMLNKPRGVVTTSHDPQDRPTTADLMTNIKARLFAVGRLDYHTEGLLIMTNDGDLAQRLQHPRYGVPKTYRAKVKGIPNPKVMARLKSGVLLDGRKTAPANVRKIGTTGKNTWLEITLKEGRNREVRRMCQAVGHPVMKLKRTRYGPLRLGDLKVGAYRRLTAAEVESLRNHPAGQDLDQPPKKRRTKNN
jgi:23S rRNA pseudouridine2605 synthase